MIRRPYRSKRLLQQTKIKMKKRKKQKNKKSKRPNEGVVRVEREAGVDLETRQVHGFATGRERNITESGENIRKRFRSIRIRKRNSRGKKERLQI